MLEAVPRSPAEMEVTWSYEAERVNSLDLYRDGELVATLSAEQTAYMEDGLSSNTRYTYRATFRLDGGLVKEAEAAAATLAYAPKLVGPMDMSDQGFQLAILDDRNPPETKYRIVLSDDAGIVSTSDEDTSRCRTFSGLRTDAWYGFEATAINLDGVESGPIDRLESRSGASGLLTQSWPAPDDTWTLGRLNAASSLYGLTESGRTWMSSDIGVEALRSEPGHAGYYSSTGHIKIGRLGKLTTVMHEMMHGFWEHWNGFPDDCAAMNVYTFNQAVARFLLDFRRRIPLSGRRLWRNGAPSTVSSSAG